MRSEFNLSASTLAHQAVVPLIEGVEGFRVEFGIDSSVRRGGSRLLQPSRLDRYKQQRHPDQPW